MNFYFDRDNLIENNVVPDKLRGELGTYFRVSEDGVFEPTNYSSNKIISSSVDNGSRNDMVMFPKYNHVINFYGSEGEFRDYIQWNEFAKEVCEVDKTYNDHHFTNAGYNYSCRLDLEHHSPDYEDFTKVYGTNLLLNYNLINYKFNNDVEKIKLFSSLKSRFEEPPWAAPNSNADVTKILEEYSQRIETFTGSLANLDRGQRFIFNLERANNGIAIGNPTNVGPFPYHFKAEVQHVDGLSRSLIKCLENTNNNKFFMQSIKKSVTFQNPYFYHNDQLIRTKFHDFTDLLNNQSIGEFVEGEDELFLLREDDLNPNHPSNRFTNQIDRINFLYKYRKILKQKSRNYKDILENKASHTFTLGYKIEKYYLNDQTLPVQTYYISRHDDIGLRFFDTQLKHGDKYIYKIFHLLGVLGSYYKYSNLLISNAEGNLQNNRGEIKTHGDNDNSKKFRARVQVGVHPSFQILEMPVAEKDVVFYDQPTMPPEVYFYNESGKKNNLLLFFGPNLTSLHDEEYVFKPITSNDAYVSEKLNLSKDNIYGTVFSSDYFSGRYEIFRLDRKPTSINDFGDNFLTEVDQTTEVLFKNTENQVSSTQSGGGYIYTQQDNNASYEDIILPNKKYYYLFRSLSYHGTPSNPTPIYEVEIRQDSDNSYVNVNEYKIPKVENTQCTKPAKRIIKITPNFEQLIFGEHYDDIFNAINDIGILDDHIIKGDRQSGWKKFKIRITSKHTGKKMDINLTFKLKKSNFPA